MHVATKTQLKDLPREDVLTIWPPAVNAANTLNDILDDWGNMSSEQAAERADRLRVLADLLDGRETAGGNQNTYS